MKKLFIIFALIIPAACLFSQDLSIHNNPYDNANDYTNHRTRSTARDGSTSKECIPIIIYRKALMNTQCISVMSCGNHRDS